MNVLRSRKKVYCVNRVCKIPPTAANIMSIFKNSLELHKFTIIFASSSALAFSPSAHDTKLLYFFMLNKTQRRVFLLQFTFIFIKVEFNFECLSVFARFSLISF